MLYYILYALCIMGRINTQSIHIEICRSPSNAVGQYYNITDSVQGPSCQYYNEQLPHVHILPNYTFNYCQNSNSFRDNAWCLANTDLYRIQRCKVPLCQEVKCQYGIQYKDLRNMTISGDSCIKWNKLPYTKSNWWNFPEASFDQLDHQECRNPDYNMHGPWCFYYGSFSLILKKPCFINQLFCPEYGQSFDCKLPGIHYNGPVAETYDFSCENETCSSSTTIIPTCNLTTTMDICKIPYCRKYNDCWQASTSYFYQRQITDDGEKCVPWSTTPMALYYMEFPENNNQHSFCRNPKVEMKVPWCYIRTNQILEPKQCFKNFCSFTGIYEALPCQPRNKDIFNASTYDILFFHKKCRSICYVTISESMVLYPELSPQYVYAELFQFHFIKSDNDFALQFVIYVPSIRFYVCSNGIELVLIDSYQYNSNPTVCMIYAICDSYHFNSSWNLYKLFFRNFMKELCLDQFVELTDNLNDCEHFALVKHPFAFQMTSQFNTTSNQFQMALFQSQYLTQTQTFPIIMKFYCNFCVFYTRIPIGTTHIENVLNYCQCLCFFQYKILVEFNDNGIKIYKGFQTIIGNSMCRLYPASTFIYPMFFRYGRDKEFKFQITYYEFDINLYVIPEINVNCITYEKTIYVVNLLNCCYPPCIISIQVLLINKINRMAQLGIYKMFLLPFVVMNFIPPKSVKIVVKYQRNITCKFHPELKNFKWLTFIMKYNGKIVNTNRNKLFIPIDESTEHGNSTIVCELHSRDLNNAGEKLIEMFETHFYFVNQFQAFIQNKKEYLREQHEFMCRTNQNPRDQMLNNYSWIGNMAPLVLEQSSFVLHLCDYSLCLKLPSYLPRGFYKLTCSIYLMDYNEAKSEFENYEAKDFVEFYKMDLATVYLYPDEKFYFIQETIQCKPMDPSINSTKLIITQGNTPIAEIDNDAYLLPKQIQSGIYTITCKYKTIYYEVQRRILNQAMFIFPNLVFYELKRRLIKCEVNSTIQKYNVQFSAKLHTIDGRSDSFFRETANSVYLKSSLKNGLHVVKCSLHYSFNRDEKLEIEFLDTNVDAKIFLLSFISVPRFIIQFIDYNKNQSKVFLNGNLTASFEPNSSLLNEIVLEWSATFHSKPANIFDKVIKNNPKSTATFLSDTTPGIYLISVYYDYRDYSVDRGYFFKRYSTTEQFDLTGTSNFTVQPAYDVYLYFIEVCCYVINVVPVNLYIVYIVKYKQSKDISEPACLQMGNYEPNLQYEFICTLNYNKHIEKISKKVLYLDIPRRLYTFPESPRIAQWIKCFPYPFIFDYAKYSSLNFSMNWTIVTMPKIDRDLFGDVNVSVSETEEIGIKFSELFASFGLYELKCDFNITIINKTFRLTKREKFTIEDFDSPLVTGKLDLITAPKNLSIIVGLSLNAVIIILFFGISFYQRETFYLEETIKMLLVGHHRKTNQSTFKHRDYFMHRTYQYKMIFDAILTNLCLLIADSLQEPDKRLTNIEKQIIILHNLQEETSRSSIKLTMSSTMPSIRENTNKKTSFSLNDTFQDGGSDRKKKVRAKSKMNRKVSVNIETLARLKEQRKIIENKDTLTKGDTPSGIENKHHLFKDRLHNQRLDSAVLDNKIAQLQNAKTREMIRKEIIQKKLERKQNISFGRTQDEDRLSLTLLRNSSKRKSQQDEKKVHIHKNKVPLFIHEDTSKQPMFIRRQSSLQTKNPFKLPEEKFDVKGILNKMPVARDFARLSNKDLEESDKDIDGPFSITKDQKKVFIKAEDKVARNKMPLARGSVFVKLSEDKQLEEEDSEKSDQTQKKISIKTEDKVTTNKMPLARGSMFVKTADKGKTDKIPLPRGSIFAKIEENKKSEENKKTTARPSLLSRKPKEGKVTNQQSIPKSTMFSKNKPNEPRAITRPSFIEKAITRPSFIEKKLLEDANKQAPPMPLTSSKKPIIQEKSKSLATPAQVNQTPPGIEKKEILPEKINETPLKIEENKVETEEDSEVTLSME